jgi:hypothetical protein
VTVHGITMTLEQFYTDATRTFLALQVQTPASQPAPYGASEGSFIAANGTATSIPFGGSLENTSAGMRNWLSFALLPSQPIGMLGAQQTATLTVNRMVLEEDNLDHFLIGPWQLHFSFTSVGPHSTEDLTCATQTHQGFAIQLLSVVQAPAPQQFDGYPGGITLNVCYVAPNDQGFNGFPGFDYDYQSSVFGGMSLAGVIHPPETEAMLTLPNRKQVTPQFENYPPVVSGYWAHTCHIGGKAGNEFGLTYLADASAFTGRAVLTVPTIISDTNRFPPVDGPWTFSFDLK